MTASMPRLKQILEGDDQHVRASARRYIYFYVPKIDFSVLSNTKPIIVVKMLTPLR